MSYSRSNFTHRDYSLGWISALPTELAAAEYMLDEVHTGRLEQDSQDTNVYVRGRISGHNVVIACLPSAGTNAAAIAAIQMQRSYPDVKFGLMVGIGGAAPRGDNDIRLGDIVVSLPGKDHSGVVQIDFGTRIHQGADGFKRTGILNKPPRRLINAVQRLIAKHKVEEPKYNEYISVSAMKAKAPKMARTFVHQGEDHLFKSNYKHQHPDSHMCESCDKKYAIQRKPRLNLSDDVDLSPVAWYGNIASSNHVMRDATTRDIIAKRENVLCFEMEAAGLMDDYPCIMIRGICDYADSHKSKLWQDYAALVAAAYAKELLLYIPGDDRPSMSSKNIAQPNNVYWLMPRSSNVLFTGRRRTLDKLTRVLCSSSDGGSSMQKRFALIGMGGSGKSEVSIKFAEENRERFWGIFWIDAVNDTMAQGSFANIAKICKLPEDSVDSVKRWLSNLNEPWLLIIDNADDLNFDYSQYIPPGIRGTVLITSRIQDLEELATVGHEQFEKLDEDDATLLLQRAMGPAASSGDQNSEAVKTVVDLLGSHALAIIQAGAFIKNRMCTIDRYPAVYDNQRKQLLRYSPRQAQSNYGDVYATFEVSARALKADSSQENVDALELLDILSLFHRDGVQEAIFERSWVNAQQTLYESESKPPGDSSKKEEEAETMQDIHTTSEDIEIISSWHAKYVPKFLGDLRQEEPDLLRFRQARNILAALSLIRVDYATGNTSMHSLAHSWANDRLTLSQQNASFLVASSTLCVFMGQSINGAAGKFLSREYFRNLLPHIESILKLTSLKPFLAEHGFRGGQIIYRCCQAAGRGRRNDLTLGILEEMCKFWNISLRPGMTQAEIQFCYLYWMSRFSAGKMTDTSELRALLRSTDPAKTEPYVRIVRLISYVSALWGTAREDGEITAAALKEAIAASTDDYKRRLLNLALAGTYFSMGFYEAAIVLYKEVLEHGAFDPTSMHYILTSADLWECYMESNRLEEAMQFMNNVIQKQEKIFDQNEYELSTSYHRLAQVYMKMEEHELAVEILEKVLFMRLYTGAPDADITVVQVHLDNSRAALSAAVESNDIIEGWEDLGLS